MPINDKTKVNDVNNTIKFLNKTIDDNDNKDIQNDSTKKVNFTKILDDDVNGEKEALILSKEFEIILFITLFIPFISPNTPVINEYELESAKCLGKIIDIEAINSLICDKKYDNDDKIFSNPYKDLNNINYQNNIVNINKIKEKHTRNINSTEKNFININKEAIFEKSYSNKTTDRKINSKYDIKLLKNGQQNDDDSKHVKNFSITSDSNKITNLNFTLELKNDEDFEFKKPK